MKFFNEIIGVFCNAEYEIKRDNNLEQLIKRKDNGLIKIVAGIRKCGKSFLLGILLKKHLLESE